MCLGRGMEDDAVAAPTDQTRIAAKRGQLSDKDPLTDEEMIRRVEVPE